MESLIQINTSPIIFFTNNINGNNFEYQQKQIFLSNYSTNFKVSLYLMLFGIDSNWSNWEILDVYTPQSKNDRLYFFFTNYEDYIDYTENEWNTQKLMTYMKKKIIQHNYSTEFKISLFSLLSCISASHENFNKTFIPILNLENKYSLLYNTKTLNYDLVLNNNVQHTNINITKLEANISNIKWTGDINEDGTVDFTDVNYLNTWLLVGGNVNNMTVYYLGQKYEIKNINYGDLDKDGTITFTDLLYLRTFLAMGGSTTSTKVFYNGNEYKIEQFTIEPEPEPEPQPQPEPQPVHIIVSMHNNVNSSRTTTTTTTTTTAGPYS